MQVPCHGRNNVGKGGVHSFSAWSPSHWLTHVRLTFPASHPNLRAPKLPLAFTSYTVWNTLKVRLSQYVES